MLSDAILQTHQYMASLTKNIQAAHNAARSRLKMSLKRIKRISTLRVFAGISTRKVMLCIC